MSRPDLAKKVAIIDYGAGNILSILRGVEKAGGQATLIQTAEEIEQAERLILPGVGAFGRAMEELTSRNLVGPIRDAARSGRPLLGICLGMQLMMEKSEEFGLHDGLALFPGIVRAMPKRTSDGGKRKIPHIGWNDLLEPAPGRWRDTLLQDTPTPVEMYFVHSYSAHPEDTEACLATTRYDELEIVSAIQSGNMTGFQPHPERSGPVGLKVLSNFLQQAATPA